MKMAMVRSYQLAMNVGSVSSVHAPRDTEFFDVESRDGEVYVLGIEDPKLDLVQYTFFVVDDGDLLGASASHYLGSVEVSGRRRYVFCVGVI